MRKQLERQYRLPGVGFCMASAEALGELETIIMPRRCIRFSLAFIFLLSSNAWALGLGEIHLDSALNAPMRAQIELLSASPEELENLVVALASAETFARYGLDRPYYLQDLQFEIVRSDTGSYVSITSSTAMSEPFLTFLVEATWSRGRLLREYTVLLDPPTFAPPAAADTRPAVTAPQRSAPTDSARIERQPQPRPAAREPEAPRRPVPAPPPRTEPQPVADTPARSFDTSAGGDYIVQRRETLWGIASRFRPDSRLSMNQTMLAIFEANPEAFGGNINILRAGASLRVPSADDIYRIDRSYALDEARRQHAAWGGMPPPAPTVDPVETSTRPSLTLVPPDEEPVGVGTGIEGVEDGAPTTREQEVLDRIAELEAADVPQQRSLIEIRDNELATLRQELADIRGEIYEPPVEDVEATDDALVDDADETAPDEDLFADTDEAMADDAAADTDSVIQPPSNVISSPTRSEPTLVDTILGYLTSIWTIIGGAVILAAGVLFWFVRRGRGDDDELESWTSRGSQSPDLDDTSFSATETLRAPAHDESIVVVEEESGLRPLDEDTVDAPGLTAGLEATGDTGEFGSLEDTFSSETAVNLDQSDPIAEADFHMAYGLYDQAADLINGALEVDAERLDLLTKLCEIYFVWGNRDAFVDAAQRVHQVAGDSGTGEWDKIVIMGQQIAGDHGLFAGAGVAGATKAVDLSFEADMDEASALDMDFGEAGGEADDVIDLGAGAGGDDDIIDLGGAADESEDIIDLGADFGAPADDDAVDFVLEDEETVAAGSEEAEEIDFAVTQETPTMEASTTEEETAEMPSSGETVETPTIEEQFAGFDVTSELPSIPDAVDEAIADSGLSSDATAEINLDELGLDLGGLDETELASLDDIDDLAETELASLDDELDITSTHEILEDTGINEVLPDLIEATGKNPEIDPEATGVRRSLDPAATGMVEELDIDDPLSATGAMRLAPDETGQNPMMQQVDEDTDVGFDESLLDATGRTQILPEDFAVETAAEFDAVISDQEETLLATMDDDEPEGPADQDATMLAPTMDDDGDFDFAKTEALPKDVFTGNMGLDETGELPAIASTDVDLDLDDLTAALKVSEMGDTVDMPRDDATVEHVRPNIEADDTTEVPTMSLSPEDMSEDLHEARTMTEVGTKLDLARAYVDMGDPGGARSILEEVLDEGDESQRQQAQQLLDTLPG